MSRSDWSEDGDLQAIVHELTEQAPSPAHARSFCEDFVDFSWVYKILVVVRRY